MQTTTSVTRTPTVRVVTSPPPVVVSHSLQPVLPTTTTHTSFTEFHAPHIALLLTVLVVFAVLFLVGIGFAIWAFLRHEHRV